MGTHVSTVGTSFRACGTGEMPGQAILQTIHLIMSVLDLLKDMIMLVSG